MGAKVVLSWTNASYDLVAQRIERKVGTGDFVELTEVLPDAQHAAETPYTYEDTDVSTTEEVTYVYRIVSISSGNDEVRGNEFTIAIPAGTVAVTNLNGELITE